VKVASAQPLPGVDPACSSAPKPFRWFASRVAKIELTAFEHISRRAIPRHLLGLERSPDFGRIVKTVKVTAGMIFLFVDC
jgi:hypothetical protein